MSLILGYLLLIWCLLIGLHSEFMNVLRKKINQVDTFYVSLYFSQLLLVHLGIQYLITFLLKN